MRLEFTVSSKIRKPILEVFEAFVDPDLCSAYFMESSTGRLTAGRTVTWDFGKGGRVDVDVLAVEANSSVSLQWRAHGVQYKTQIHVRFIDEGAGSSRVSVHASGWNEDSSGLRSCLVECAGWTEMLKNLKAKLEHGIDLR